MTYKLINNATKEETICSLVTIDDFDYYINGENLKENEICPYIMCWLNGTYELFNSNNSISESKRLSGLAKKVIATNNPNIDTPKVINEVENISYNWLYDNAENTEIKYPLVPMEYGFQNGYVKAKETYQYTEENLISFAAFCSDNHTLDDSDKSNICWQPIFKDGQKQTTQELLSIWKEQQPKILYYES